MNIVAKKILMLAMLMGITLMIIALVPEQELHVEKSQPSHQIALH